MGGGIEGSWLWRQSHNDVVQELLRKARKGTRRGLVPGSHDAFLREHVGNRFGGVEVVERALHTTADGTRFLVLHGDEFDSLVRHHRWLATLGDRAHRLALAANRWLNWARLRLERPYWSLAAHFEPNVESAVAYAAGSRTPWPRRPGARRPEARAIAQAIPRRIAATTASDLECTWSLP